MLSLRIHNANYWGFLCSGTNGNPKGKSSQDTEEEVCRRKCQELANDHNLSLFIGCNMCYGQQGAAIRRRCSPPSTPPTLRVTARRWPWVLRVFPQIALHSHHRKCDLGTTGERSDPGGQCFSKFASEILHPTPSARRRPHATLAWKPSQNAHLKTWHKQSV